MEIFGFVTLLLVDEDFIHYTYIEDDGEVMEFQV